MEISRKTSFLTSPHSFHNSINGVDSVSNWASAGIASPRLFDPNFISFDRINLVRKPRHRVKEVALQCASFSGGPGVGVGGWTWLFSRHRTHGAIVWGIEQRSRIWGPLLEGWAFLQDGSFPAGSLCGHITRGPGETSMAKNVQVPEFSNSLATERRRLKSNFSIHWKQ